MLVLYSDWVYLCKNLRYCLIKIVSHKTVYLLRSDLNSLSDQFEVIKIYKSSKKYLFKNKNNAADFRIKPTFANSKKFSFWVLKKKEQKPNFFNAQRIHLIIDQMIRSSKQKKKIYIGWSAYDLKTNKL